ncbi:hypothetical protein SJI19_04660 [Acerihabitans sp. TG2]|nr:hypothetical protein [Acerihabitans sp. TG2]MEA9389850.1 hypothetical protein [Acerihabitans sp. TG2]
MANLLQQTTLKGKRTVGVEAGMVFLPARVPLGTLSPSPPNLQQAC